MSYRERIIVYTVLIALVAMNAMLFLSQAGPSALAQDATQEETDASAVPAPSAPEAVDSITFAGEGDADPLVLQNHEGRLAWGDSPYDRTYSIAYVNIGDVLNGLMQASEFADEREPLMNELREEEEVYRQRLEDLRSRMEGLDPQSEEAGRLYQEGQRVHQEYVNWQQQAIDRLGKLDAEHLERAYRTFLDAVAIVADRRNIDIIYRFIPTDEPFNAENPEQAMLNIRLRPVLHYPEELDITDAVMDELALEQP
jgi:hypothetical protein